jgi:mono/diheme cytochrome c family protein
MRLSELAAKSAILAAVGAVITVGLISSKAAVDPVKDAAVDVHMRTPADELATIVLPEGYHLELVACEPDVICPVLCDWDGNGRMYVAEMRSYMLDINGAKAHTPISRVSRWEQTKNDGVYDKHTVYADHLMLPRMVLPLDDRVLIRETDTKDIWCYRDSKSDGVSDEKTRFYEGGKQEGNLEHQPSGLFWDIDNWIYVTNQNERFRYTRGKVEKEPLPFHPGQWGIAITDTGQLIFSTAGSERPAHNFQVMPQYGDIGLPGELAKNFEAVYPIEYLTDVEGGLPRLRPEGGLNHFSGCAGPSIFRGDALPQDLYGDLIIPEPVGRMIRRAKVTVENGKTVLTNAYDQKEFIASTDPNFRPVWSATGPDGCLYICDMYHGIIQEANWTKEGTYLRPQIQKYGLQKNINRGRIWRLVHDGFKPRQQPHMLQEKPEELVKHLADPNGWWRDTAQKLIILKADKSVVPTLVTMARSDANPITRLHALWTLEGLDSITDDLLIARLKDADPRLREAAVRIAEPLLAKDKALADAIKAEATDVDPQVAGQVCLSVQRAALPDAAAIVASATADKLRPVGDTDYVKTVSQKYTEVLTKVEEDKRKAAEMAKADAAKGELFNKGREAYGQTCIACHAPDGMGMPAPEHNGTTLAPPLKGSRKLLADRQLVARIILHGLTGPNNGKLYPGQMASFKWADDLWLASILTYARNDWGNTAPAIKPEDIADVRKLTVGRNQPFTQQELYEATQSTAPVTPTGARVIAGPGEILLDPTTVELHGDIHVDCYPSGLDIGYWNNWQDWAGWKTPTIPPGDYTIFARTSQPDAPTDFYVKIAGQEFFGSTKHTNAWDEYHDLPVGVVHIDQPGELTVEFHPRGPENWRPTNLAAIRLVPK